MVLLCPNPAAVCRRTQALPRTPAIDIVVHNTYLSDLVEAKLDGNLISADRL